ncbi:MAG TPA: glycosyltransferase family 39 protein [Anaerolineales bacterium]
MARGEMGWLNSVRKAAESDIVLLGAKVVAAGLVGYFDIAFLYVAISRMGYMFTLEWLEGASLIAMRQLLAGHPLYVQPTFQYVPLIYSPLYYYVSALFAGIVGFGFLPLRLVSFLATLGCVALIYVIMKHATADSYVSLMAAGSLLALYKISDTWFDLARVDMLAVFFTLLAVYLMQRRSTLRLVLAGIAFSLAALTKQTYWIPVPAMCLYAFFLHGRKGWLVAGSVLVVSVPAHLILNRLFQGWYSFFVYAAGFGQASTIFSGGLVHFFSGYWVESVLKVIPILFALFVVSFDLTFRGRRETLAALALAGGMVLLSWLGILNKGGYNNVLIPSYIIFLIGAWLAIGTVLKDPAASNAARSGLLILISVQLGLLWYPVARQIPTASDFKAGRAILQDIRSQPGDVYVPFENYLALYAGKTPFAGFGSLGDLNQLPGGIGKPEWNRINAELRDRIRSQNFSVIILDQNADWGSAQKYYDTYYQATPIQYNQGEFFPVAGWQIRPGFWYTPIRSSSSTVP